jgi:signal transduction histidine kinase
MNKMLDVVSSNSGSTGDSSRVDVIPLLQETIRLREKANSKPLPVLSSESPGCEVKADKDQLLAIFGHLVQNAQDATADDGRIDIIQSIDDGQLVLEFRDSGHGMDEDFIKNQLFKPFKSTKGKGMGIGVYETKEIIHALGGSIDVESSPGAGSCFTIKLPKA